MRRCHRVSVVTSVLSKFEVLSNFLTKFRYVSTSSFHRSTTHLYLLFLSSQLGRRTNSVKWETMVISLLVEELQYPNRGRVNLSSRPESRTRGLKGSLSLVLENGRLTPPTLTNQDLHFYPSITGVLEPDIYRTTLSEGLRRLTRTERW